jgi:hypothetical protein
MFRSLGLLVVLAGIAGYFTKPTEAQHRDAARATLEQIQQDAFSNLDIGALVDSSIARLGDEGRFQDYVVASRYTVEVNQRPIADCWGAFTQVRCTPAAADMAAAVKDE